jgi:hypothetical protein
LASILLLACTFKLAIDPFTPLWGVMAPARYAAWRLSTVYAIPPITPAGCYSRIADYWRRIASAPEASIWFQAVYREAKSPSARLAALAGLQAADSTAYVALRQRRLSAPETLIPVETGETILPVPIGTVLDSLESGAFVASLWASARWPEC